MRAFLAVFRRELFERRFLAAVGWGFGLLALALPLVPGLARTGLPPAEIRSGAALSFALLLGAGLAVLLGGSFISSDLVEKRMGFYFARPIPGWAVWCGKAAAALVLILAVILLTLAPSIFAGALPDTSGYWSLAGMNVLGGDLLLVLAMLVVLLLLVSHAASVMFRSRSPWVALDLAACVLIGFLIWSTRERLIMAGLAAMGRINQASLLTFLEMSLILLVVVAFFVAGAVQVSLGRTDLRRGHRILSATLWGGLLLLALAFEGTARWVLAASPEDLQGVRRIVSSPDGSWLAFSGPASRRAGYEPGFLFHPASGRTIRAPFGVANLGGDGAVEISADGRRAAWLEFLGRPFESPRVVVRLDLDRPYARPVRTLVSFPFSPSAIALSPDGRQLASLLLNRIVVSDLDSGRDLLSVSLPGELGPATLVFVGPGRLRLHRGFEWSEADVRVTGVTETSFHIHELDLATRKLQRTGSVTNVRSYLGWGLSPEGDLALLRGRKLLQLRDARTGAMLADLSGGERPAGSFLPDGRLVVTRQAAGDAELLLLTPDGRSELRRFLFPGKVRLLPAEGEDSGRLRVLASAEREWGTAWEAWLLDLATGTSQLQGRRDLAVLKPVWERGGVLSFEGKDGVVWFDNAAARLRAVLR